MSKISIHAEDAGAFFARARKLARAVDAGERVARQAHLSFESLDLLLATLTPNRWALMRALRQRGPSSIRALAAMLGRDYKAVHTDVAKLVDAGLIEKAADGSISMPWTRISAAFELAAA